MCDIPGDIAPPPPPETGMPIDHENKNDIIFDVPLAGSIPADVKRINSTIQQACLGLIVTCRGFQVE